MSDASSIELLRAGVQARVTEEAAGWFDSELASLARAPTLDSLLAAFSAASRRLGREPLLCCSRGPSPARFETASLEGPLDRVPLAPFGIDVASRAALLLTLAERAPELLEQGVWAAYREGDTLEKVAVVRSLALLPEQARFVELSLDAGRTNDTRLFTAVACDNPFPARHYPELEFNKLFMKAAFVRVELGRILGLERRANPELSRMAADYVAEQESAGRSFPPEIWRAVGFFPPPGAVAKMLGYANHSVREMRLHAAHGLEHVREQRIVPFLIERLEIEGDESVRTALRQALAVSAANHDRSSSA